MFAFIHRVLSLLILKPGYFLVAAISAVNSATSAGSDDNLFMQIQSLPSLLITTLNTLEFVWNLCCGAGTSTPEMVRYLNKIWNMNDISCETQLPNC